MPPQWWHGSALWLPTDTRAPTCPPRPPQVYKRVLDKPAPEARLAGVCQRENSFYVDTVRAFRCGAVATWSWLRGGGQCRAPARVCDGWAGAGPGLTRRAASPSRPLSCTTPGTVLLYYQSYRDRRYEYKGLTKVWKGKLDDAKVGGG